MTRYLVISSAAAGGTDDEAVAAAVDVLGDAELVRTTTEAELDAALDTLGDRRLVLAGGDGSVHLVANRLGDRLAATPIGLLPLGTGNDLARALGLPLEPADAARVILTAVPRELDLVVDDTGLRIVNAVHVGVGADAAEAASRLKPRLGPLAYPIGAVAAGLRTTGERLRVSVDGSVVSEGRRLLMVGITNGRTIGGGTPLAPDGAPDDARLDVMVSAAVGPLARLGYGVALKLGRHPERADVRTARGREVTIDTGAAEVGVNADGEVSRLRGRRSWRLEPGAWSVLAPRAPSFP